MWRENGGGGQREGRVMGLGKRVHEGAKARKPLIKMGKQSSFTGATGSECSLQEEKKKV